MTMRAVPVAGELSVPAGPRGPAGGVTRLVLALGGAGVLAASFPPYSWLGGWLAAPAFALLVAAFRDVSGRLGSAMGLASGMVFFGVLLGWMRVLGPDAWLLLSLLCASFWAVAGGVLPRLLRGRLWVLSVPAMWVVMESVRGQVPWGGFPWGRLAFSQADTSLVGWAGLAGPSLVTFVVCLGGMVILAGWQAARRGDRRTVATALLASGALVGAGAAGVRVDWAGPSGSAVPIAVVQGNVPRAGLDARAQRRAVLDNHVAATRQLAARVRAGESVAPAAVVWPENAADIDPLRDPEAAADITAAAQDIGAPLLVGAVISNPDDPPTEQHPGTVLNVGIVWDPTTGPGDRYAKRHPVPFGEYLPYRDLLSRFITRFDRIPRDFAPGQQPGVLTLGPVLAGVVICFEIAYDDLVRDAVKGGGQVLLVQTNNATYGRTGQPAQQLAISRVQAIASGRTTLVAATSGLSAIIDEHGKARWQTTEFTQDTTVETVSMRTGLTPAMRLGSTPDLLAAVLLLTALLLGRRPPHSSAD
ncbi:MAG: apolipoprotein N-acyltransferase [Candidatus Nanopelagicales bacterium]